MPLMMELFAGLHGWGIPAVELGYRVVGFDIVDMCQALNQPRPPGIDLVIQDVLTLSGSQFRDADCIVGSPPCPEYSYMAQPWKRGKAIAAALRGQGEFPEGYEGSRTLAELNALFDACFRIQREASEAAGRYIPMVVENVKGAQPWVGKAKANFGSFYLWGDVERIGRRIVRSGPVSWGMEAVAASGRMKRNPDGTDHPQGSWFAIADSKNRGGRKGPGGDWFEDGRQGQDACREAIKNNGNGTWFGQSHGQEYPAQPGNARDKAAKVAGISFSGHGTPGYKAQGFNVTAAQRYREESGTKQEGSGPEWFDNGISKHSSRSDSRKAASAEIAKIPPALAQHIARIFKPACNGVGSSV